MIEKYYEEELRYLYESGREFARTHPDRARFLNIDAVSDRDPYVERLFEGFAFLTGRIREKLDDSFPELTEGLVNLLWPLFQQEIPALSIVEFKPRKGFLQESRILERGAELLSNPVGPESAICTFTTTQDVTLNPISLYNVNTRVDTHNRATLTFHFQVSPGVPWQNLSLSPLRLYIHAEMPTALTLHRLLTRHVINAEIAVDGDRGRYSMNAREVVTPGGLTADEALMPVDSRTFWGYALLLEYFVFPEKFHFFDLHGCTTVPIMDPSPERFSISLTFDTNIPPNTPFNLDTFRLHCAPVVNLFKKDTEPVITTGMATEYQVIADSMCLNSFTTHSIISVEGADRSTGEQNKYIPFHSFKALGNKRLRTYTSHYRPGFDGRRELFIALGGEHLDSGDIREENLSIEAWVSNGVLPREEIHEGDISKPGAGFPDYIMFSNITRPSLPSKPPGSDEYLWVFLSHLSATYASFGSADILKAFLRLYEWSHTEGRARRIEAISEVTYRPIESLVGGSILRGIEFTIAIQEGNFQDCDDLHIFAEVLKTFLSQYISINSFLDLVVVTKPSGRQMQWSSLRGVKWPI